MIDKLLIGVQVLGYIGILVGFAMLVLSGPPGRPQDYQDHQLLDGEEPGLPRGRHSRG